MERFALAGGVFVFFFFRSRKKVVSFSGQLSQIHGSPESMPESLKVIPWFCTAHLLLRITRWPP